MDAEAVTATDSRPARPSQGLLSPSWAGAEDRLVCTAVHDEAPGAKTFRFTAASGARFAFLPGQFITIEIPLAPAAVWRSFTIASAPTRPEAIELTIKAQPTGRATRWLHERLRPAMTLRAKAPAGPFYLDRLAERPLLLLSAGSGATPMASIVRWLHDLNARVPVHYLHVGRREEDLLFRAEIEAIAARLGGWRIDWIVTQSTQAAEGLRSGRPDAALLQMILPDLARADVFCCGPTGFMAAARAAHAAVGGEPRAFRQEGFGVAPEPATDAVAGSTHLVRFEPSGREVLVGAEETLLAAAARCGLVIPHSCREGVCGTCRIRKLSGEVDMRHQGGIFDDEIESGDVLACCSYPRSTVSVRALQ
jgi:glycine betaine catabolism B